MLDNLLCEQCKCKGEDVLHAIWNYENLQKGWVQSFAKVRSKFSCIVKEDGKSLEEFAMTTWLI